MQSLLTFSAGKSQTHKRLSVKPVGEAVVHADSNGEHIPIPSMSISDDSDVLGSYTNRSNKYPGNMIHHAQYNITAKSFSPLISSISCYYSSQILCAAVTVNCVY